MAEDVATWRAKTTVLNVIRELVYPPEEGLVESVLAISSVKSAETVRAWHHEWSVHGHIEADQRGKHKRIELLDDEQLLHEFLKWMKAEEHVSV
ncbi:unnamed protein product, partial [Chrysoparadoxa australica]